VEEVLEETSGMNSGCLWLGRPDVAGKQGGEGICLWFDSWRAKNAVIL